MVDLQQDAKGGGGIHTMHLHTQAGQLMAQKLTVKVTTARGHFVAQRCIMLGLPNQLANQRTVLFTKRYIVNSLTTPYSMV